MTEHYKNMALDDIVDFVDGELYYEEWRPVVGYVGLYKVSSFGRIKSVERNKKNNGGFVRVAEKILKQHKNETGYLRCTLSKDGKATHIFVHRLVGFSFLEGDKTLDINHKDTNPLNNFFKNLEFGTEQYNMLYALYVSETKGSINANIASNIRRLFLSGKGISEIAIELSISIDIVPTVLNGRSWTLKDDAEVIAKCKQRYCTGRSIKKPLIAVSLLDNSEIEFACISEAARKLGLNIGNISQCLLGNKRERVGNYKFKNKN